MEIKEILALGPLIPVVVIDDAGQPRRWPGRSSPAASA